MVSAFHDLMNKTLRSYSVAEREIQLLTSDEEACLNAAVRGDAVDPYWGKVWDSAIPSAECVLKNDWALAAGLKTIELGCGLGLVGITGLLAGLDVTFSDHEPQAVERAIENAATNGFENCDGLVMNWAKPVSEKFDVILASDVLYEASSHEALLTTASKLLLPSGKFCIGDPGRWLAKDFLNLAMDDGWKVKLFDGDMKQATTPASNQFQWIELRK